MEIKCRTGSEHISAVYKAGDEKYQEMIFWLITCVLLTTTLFAYKRIHPSLPYNEHDLGYLGG